jgi:uncharacterized protein (DUF305 family)
VDGDDRLGPTPVFTIVPTIALVAIVATLAALATWWLTKDDDPELSGVDIGFLADMTTHHQGAIQLAFAYLPRESDGTVGHIAREIVVDQSAEIGTMNGLVGDAGHDADAILNDDVAMEWMGEPVAPARMPGLATADEFDALRAASGVAADDVFTRLMIEHHAAGVEMADFAAANASDDRVVRFARGIAAVQQREIVELNGRRRALGLDPVETEGAHAHGEP